MEDIIIPNFTLIRQSSYICSLNLDLEHRGLTSTEKGERELRGEFSFQLISQKKLRRPEGIDKKYSVMKSRDLPAKIAQPSRAIT